MSWFKERWRRGRSGAGNGDAIQRVYVTDFSEYETGVQPDDWTVRYNDQRGTWSVVEDVGSLGGKHLKYTAVTNGLIALTSNVADALADREDVEILMKVRHNETPAAYSAGTWVRGSGAMDSETGYSIAMTTNSLVSFAHVNGIANQVGFGVAFTPQPLVWYWVRHRVQGADVKFRVWADGDPEPEAWTGEAASEHISDAGWIGLRDGGGSTDMRDYDYFSVVTGGGIAPGPA